MEIARKFIPFLVKQIIYSHVWVQRKDTKVYLQSYVVCFDRGDLGLTQLL